MSAVVAPDIVRRREEGVAKETLLEARLQQKRTNVSQALKVILNKHLLL